MAKRSKQPGNGKQQLAKAEKPLSIRSLARIYDMLTDQERLALEIAACTKPPEGRYTRKWAERILRDVTRSRLVALSAIDAMSHDEIELHMRRYEYFVEKPKQGVEVSGEDGGAIPLLVIREHIGRVPPGITDGKSE